jgi:hypothetical protein
VISALERQAECGLPFRMWYLTAYCVSPLSAGYLANPPNDGMGMAHRKFIDRDGNEWEILVTGQRSEWEFGPVGDNSQPARTVQSPGYEKDPFELSKEELQGLLDESTARSTRSVKSPFKD